MAINIKSKDINLKKFSAENVIKMRESFPGVEDDTLARFLIARNNDLTKAIEQYSKLIEWRAKSYPILKSSCAKEIDSGRIVVRGVDKEGRPLLIFRTRFSNAKVRHLEDSVKMCVWWAETIIKELPDDKSKFTVLVDRSNHKNENADIDLVKRAAAEFQILFPERLQRAIIFPSDLLFYTVWAIIKWFLDPVTREKVQPMLYFYGVEQYIDKQYIPKSMGGDDDYEFNTNDFDDPYPAEVVQAALLASGVGSMAIASSSSTAAAAPVTIGAEDAVSKPSGDDIPETVFTASAATAQAP